MCLEKIGKLFKGKGGSTYGYKIAYLAIKEDAYRPLYCCAWERWKIGKWYTASGNECNSYANAKARKLFGHLFSKFSKVKLIVDAGVAYEPGYHYFDTLEQVVKAYDTFGGMWSWRNIGNVRKVILYCEFKEKVAEGKQFGYPSRVSRRMMPMEEISINQAKAALAVERGDTNGK